MTAQQGYALLADAVLVLHAFLVLFVVLGLLVIWLGNVRRWPWVNAMAWRATHLAAIGVVVLQAWLGQACPLTTLEQWLRWRSGLATHDQGFIAHWLQRLLFYSAPEWVFVLAYSLFGLTVVWTWWRFPPKRRA